MRAKLKASSVELSTFASDLDAVFVDLDDTIVDYRYPCIVGLAQVRRAVPTLSRVDVGTMENDFREILRSDLPGLLDGETTEEEERINRLMKIIRKHGGYISPRKAVQLDRLYMDGFWNTRSVMEGAIELLQACETNGIPVVVITNGNDEIQKTTLDKLNLKGYIRLLLTPTSSEEMKPNVGLFQRGLDFTGAKKERTVMIGDTWHQDVQGALNTGIIPVWVNRRKIPRPEQRDVLEVNSLTKIASSFE